MPNGLFKKRCGGKAKSAKELKWYWDLCPKHQKYIESKLKELRRSKT